MSDAKLSRTSARGRSVTTAWTRSPAAPTTAPTSRCRACCTARSSAARTRTRASCRSTPSAAEACPASRRSSPARTCPKTTAQVWLGGEGALDLHDMGDNLLAHEKALYHGHAVAAVAATSLEIAREAANAHRGRLRACSTPVLSIDQAIAPDAPILHDDLVTKAQAAAVGCRRADQRRRAGWSCAAAIVDKGFAEADIVVEREFHTPMVHQGYIEPHACVARVGAGRPRRRLVHARRVRSSCATAAPAILGIDAAKIKVIPSEIGGGFGGKIPVYLEPLAIVLSRKANRPVKMVMTRDEVFRATGPTSGTKIRDEDRREARRDARRRDARRCGTRRAPIAGSPSGAGAMCCLAPYTDPQLLHRSATTSSSTSRRSRRIARPARRWRRSRPNR